jgi:asparagine synthase (glutamine-hydrolysing)
LTDALKLPLLEAHYDLADIDVSQPPAPHHPWPNALFFRQGTEAIHRRYVESSPVGAHFSGNGGDAIFCNMRSALPFVDRFLVEGPRVSLGATLLDLCDLTGADGRSVLKEAWRRYRRLGEPRAPKFNGLGLQTDWLSRIAAGGFRHPWLLDVPAGALPGKAAHVTFLARAHRSLELYPRREAPPHVAPLLSQPIVELSLSIPTWAWIAGGRNRSVARTAFEGLLPDQILRRSHKGGPGGFCQAIYERHGAAMRRRLREGWLVRAGILDPDILDGAEDAGWRGVERSDRILSLAAAESWAAWWNAT